MNSDILNPEEEIAEALPVAALSVDGTPGNDVIEETGVIDTTYNMLEGNDRVNLIDGTNNIINGNQGDDNLRITNVDNSTMNGNEGDDLIQIFNGVNNTVNGNEGDDGIKIFNGVDNTVNGNEGNDTIEMNSGVNNIVSGNEGDDVFNMMGEMNNNILNGGDGNDLFTLGDHATHNIIYGDGGDDVLEIINRESTNNIFNGGEGNDTLKGAGGDEIFQFNFELETNFESISFANGIKQSNFVNEYDAWLKSLGTDLNADGKVDVVWHQNSATQPVTSVEGVDPSLFSDVKSVTLSNGQVRYYNASFGDEVLTSHDGHDLYQNFDTIFSEDKLYLSGMTRDQFTTDNFYINESEGDTILGLNDGSWSVTLAGTTGLSEIGIDGLRENADFLVFDNGVV